jgi:hypothetical protein
MGTRPRRAPYGILATFSAEIASGIRRPPLAASLGRTRRRKSRAKNEPLDEPARGDGSPLARNGPRFFAVRRRVAGVIGEGGIGFSGA